jgi:peptidoglycan endopeptidase LytF
VQAVQRRLVELGKLAASHGESPAAASTAAVPQAALRRTIAAIRSFQTDVQFWKNKGTITGNLSRGVVAPGDATATLLDRISVYQMTSGTTTITLRDHVRSGNTQSAAGVMFVGTSLPSAIPIADYVALGLTAAQAAALQFVSTHEGNFDAINTYDIARVSAGFIQFAGGRGLPPYLALLKSRQPAVFGRLLLEFGIDVEFSVSGGRIQSAQVAVLDPVNSRVLRGANAEEAIRANKRLSMALILSGRERSVQLVQIEAAIRDYVMPALAGSVTFGSLRATLGDLLRSERAMAMLFDRSIQEGTGGGRVRFERIIQAIHAVRPAATLADMQAREAEILTALETDLQAAATVASSLERALAALRTLSQVVAAPYASVTESLRRPELDQARAAIADALVAVTNVMTIPESTDLRTVLGSEQTRLRFDTIPSAVADLATALANSQQSLSAALRPVSNRSAFSNASTFLDRIRRIRQSTLRSSLTQAVGERSVPRESTGFVNLSRAEVGV